MSSRYLGKLTEPIVRYKFSARTLSKARSGTGKQVNVRAE